MKLFSFGKETQELNPKPVAPPNVGLIEYKLSTQEMDYVWRCINNVKEGRKDVNMKPRLAGNIKSSYLLKDKNEWFFNNTIQPLCKKYAELFRNVGKRFPARQYHPYYMPDMWVNYQREGEFNPIHDHSGIYSFVIWMKIPYTHEEQNRNPIAAGSNSKKIGVFEVTYSDLLGAHQSWGFEMDPKMEGTMLFFPASLHHVVYPFYNCDKDRISVSGNVMINTAKAINDPYPQLGSIYHEGATF